MTFSWKNMRKKFKIRKEGEDRYLLYIPEYRKLLITNTTGYQTLIYLEKNKSIDEVVEIFQKEYKVDRDTVKKDIENFIEKLKRYNIL